jgi:hypothetical protein
VVSFLDRQEIVVGLLEAGDEVAEAKYGLGPNGAIWTWERNGQHQWVPFEACGILDETTVEDYWRRKREAEYKLEDERAKSPPS